MKVALVLSGGGARGLAHLGVLRVLEQARIHFDYIVGCSFGAIIGGMYAQTPEVALVEKRLRQFVKTEAYHNLGLDRVRKRTVKEDDYFKNLTANIKNRLLLNLVANRLSVLKEERLRQAIEFLIRPGRIEETHIPFACNATDLVSGRPVLFTEGDIRQAILASSAIPGFFPPVAMDGKMLVDGAVSYNLPIKFARALGATFVIAVDVHPILQPQPALKNVFDVFLRANTITSTLLTEETLGEADFVISPDVGHYLWYEFDQAEAIVAAGEQAASLHLEELKRRLPGGRPHRLRRLFRLRSPQDDSP